MKALVFILFFTSTSFATEFCKTWYRPIRQTAAKIYECSNGKKYSKQNWIVEPTCDRRKQKPVPMEIFCETRYAANFESCLQDEALTTRICMSREKLPPPNRKITPVDGWGEPKKGAK